MKKNERSASKASARFEFENYGYISPSELKKLEELAFSRISDEECISAVEEFLRRQKEESRNWNGTDFCRLNGGLVCQDWSCENSRRQYGKLYFLNVEQIRQKARCRALRLDPQSLVLVAGEE